MLFTGEAKCQLIFWASLILRKKIKNSFEIWVADASYL